VSRSRSRWWGARLAFAVGGGEERDGLKYGDVRVSTGRLGKVPEGAAGPLSRPQPPGAKGVDGAIGIVLVLV